jgi:hypothetical protein
MEILKTKAFQLPPKALPGTPRKVLLLKKVAYIDNPIAHPGMVPDAFVNCSELLFFPEKYKPTITIATR